MAINWFSISKALAVRCLLTFHVIMCCWRVVVELADQQYWLLLCALLPLVCETCYTLIRRQGVEFSRFTPCFLCYLGAVLPGIWLLELNKTDDVIKMKQNNTSQSVVDKTTSNDFIIFQEILDSSTWLIVIEEMLPYVIFASRWVLPRGRVRREELAELLFAFIEIAADIMEFFSLIGDNVIRGDKTLSYCVLSIWSLSILQFTMTVTVIHQPKREKKVMVVVVESDTDKERERVRHQCFAIFLTMVMQDLPFAVMRLYTIIKFDYINYSLIFFTSKNLIIIMLLLYKVAALCKKRYQRDHEGRARDTDTKTPLNVDGAAKGSNNNTCSTSSLGRIGKQQAPGSKNEQYIDQNHFNGSVDSVLKKRSRKQEVSKKDSPDSGRTTPQSMARSTTESEDTASRHSIHLQKSDSMGYIPQLCLNCLSRIDTTSEFQNIWNMMNLPSHFRSLADPVDGVQQPPDRAGAVEHVARSSQGSIEEMRFSAGHAEEKSESSDEIKRQSPDSAVTSLVIAVGNK